MLISVIIGHINNIDNIPIKVAFEEKDLGVIGTTDLKFHKQCVE